MVVDDDRPAAGTCERGRPAEAEPLFRRALPILEKTYGPEHLSPDLASFLEPAPGSGVSFRGRYPVNYLVFPRPERLRAWHLVGGLDLLDDSERTGSEPDDGYPVTLPEWIMVWFAVVATILTRGK